MAGSWHYVKNGSRLGPVTLAELKVMLRSREITADTNVWRVGMGAWAPLRDVPEFASEASAITPELPRATGNVQPPPHPGEKPRRFSAGLRVMMIIGAVLAIGAFFAPNFYTWATLMINKDALEHPYVQAELQKVGIDTKEVAEYAGVPVGMAIFGWKLWYAILALVAGGVALVFAIVDASMPRARVMRIVNQWVLFVMFVTVFAAATTGLILGLCKVGLLAASPKEGVEPRTFSQIHESNAAGRKEAVNIRKEFQKKLEEVPAAQREERRKQMIQDQGDPAWYEQSRTDLSVLPISISAAVIGGALGLLGAILIIAKKT